MATEEARTKAFRSFQEKEVLTDEALEGILTTHLPAALTQSGRCGLQVLQNLWKLEFHNDPKYRKKLVLRGFKIT